MISDPFFSREVVAVLNGRMEFEAHFIFVRKMFESIVSGAFATILKSNRKAGGGGREWARLEFIKP